MMHSCRSHHLHALTILIISLLIARAPALPIIRRGEVATSDISPWVIRSIVIGLVLFTFTFGALYLYRTYKVPESPARPLFRAPPLQAEPGSGMSSGTPKYHRWMPWRSSSTASDVNGLQLVSYSHQTPISILDLPSLHQDDGSGFVVLVSNIDRFNLTS
ncbi:hypothetical protein CPC08DRAFT_353734 [Agrocybe pediades]|nr:hypothetical protein CPC08DRAFT_353734 [Agrocybe pediades]